MSDMINVIYNKKTGRVLIYQEGKDWVLPNGYDLAHFENGVEPVFTEDDQGNLYLKPNAMVITNY